MARRPKTAAAPLPPPAPSAQRRARSRSAAPPDEPKNDDTTIDDLLTQMSIDASGPSDMGDKEADIWVKSSGWTPVEFLTRTYRNGFQPMQHRIAAAKAILDYTHRKLPARVEVSGELGTQGVTLDGVALSKLNDKELDTLLKILEKLK